MCCGAQKKRPDETLIRQYIHMYFGAQMHRNDVKILSPVL